MELLKIFCALAGFLLAVVLYGWLICFVSGHSQWGSLLVTVVTLLVFVTVVTLLVFVAITIHDCCNNPSEY